MAGESWLSKYYHNIYKNEIKKKNSHRFLKKRTRQNSRAEFTLEPLHHTRLKALIKYSICSHHTSSAAAGIHLKSASCKSVTSIWQFRVWKGKNKYNLLIHLMQFSLKSKSRIFYKNTFFFYSNWWYNKYGFLPVKAAL